MAYHADMKSDTAASQPTHPQQTYPVYQSSYSNANPQPTGAYSNPNPQGAHYAPNPYQQGAPFAPAAQGGQYPQAYQTQPPPQQAAHVQPIIVAQPQPQVIVGQPVMMMGGCLPGQHVFTTHFGPCGIIAAILLFPIGLIFLLIDQERRCTRCGASG